MAHRVHFARQWAREKFPPHCCAFTPCGVLSSQHPASADEPHLARGANHPTPIASNPCSLSQSSGVVPFWLLDPPGISIPFADVSIAVESTILETWESLCEDPRFQGIPYKIETDESGRIVMSPTKNYHGFFASRINRLLEQLMAGGVTGNEIGIITPKGVKVPDCVWVSQERFNTLFSESASSIAPELCVEILSEANTARELTEKRDLYFRAGAKEVWTCDPQGTLRFFGPKGELRRSVLFPKFPKVLGAEGPGDNVHVVER